MGNYSLNKRLSNALSKFFVVVSCLAVTQLSMAGSLLEGKWKVVDSMGQETFVMEIFQTSTGTLSAKIIHNKSARKRCDRCKGKLKGKRLKGLVLLTGLSQVPGNPKTYTKGRLLDLSTGKYRRASVHVKNGRLFVKDWDGNLDQLWMPL